MDIKDLKQQLPTIPELVPGLKKESHRSLAGSCPKCGGDDRFVYRTDTKRFHCRRCHPEQGDIIDFYAWMYDKSITQLKREIIGVI